MSAPQKAMRTGTLPQHVVDDILSDLARGYRSTMMIASRHKVSVAVVEELRRNGRAPEPAAGMAVEPDAVEPDQAPTVAKSGAGSRADELTAEERIECRAWCKANGVKVGASGPIAQAAVAQWRREAASSNATTDEVEEEEEATLDTPAPMDAEGQDEADDDAEDADGGEGGVVDAEIADDDTPPAWCRCSHRREWHHGLGEACLSGACGCTEFRDADTIVDNEDPEPVALYPDPNRPGHYTTGPRPDLRDLLWAAVTEVDASLDYAIASVPESIEQLITACGEFVAWVRAHEEQARRVDAVEARLREAAETGELTDDLRSLAAELVRVVDAA